MLNSTIVAIKAPDLRPKHFIPENRRFLPGSLFPRQGDAAETKLASPHCEVSLPGRSWTQSISMRPKAPFLVAILFIALLFALLLRGFLFNRNSSRSTLGNNIRSALTNPVEFAKNRVTGGVGVVLRMDAAKGLPIIQGLGAGSPAERSGLHVGDWVTQVNGQSMTGLTLKAVVDSFHGITGGNVAVSVKRGDTNLNFVISRTSWNKLYNSSFVYPNTNTPTLSSTNR